MFWSFMLGILFISFIYPVLESLTGVILTFLEMIKGKITVIITQINCQIKSLADKEDDVPTTRPIGFTASFESEEEDLDEDL